MELQSSQRSSPARSANLIYKLSFFNQPNAKLKLQDNHLNQALPLIMSQVKRILFITLSNIGDAILTTPTLEALHLQYPDAVIDIVCDPRSEIIFKYCPYRGEIFLKYKKAGWRGAFSLIRQLRRQQYDIAVDLRSDGLLWLLRAKRRAFKLANRLSLNLHSVEKHFAAVKKLVINTSPPMPKIWLSDKEREAANLILGTHREQRILALGVGANFAGKIWPVEHFQALSDVIKNQFDFILLLGGLGDVDLAVAFKSRCALPVLDCCGKTDLLTTAALLEHADYFVGNDSGLGHLASALGTPSITVFGVGQPHRYRPWGDKALWLQDAGHNIANISAKMVAKKIVSGL